MYKAGDIVKFKNSDKTVEILLTHLGTCYELSDGTVIGISASYSFHNKTDILYPSVPRFDVGDIIYKPLTGQVIVKECGRGVLIAFDGYHDVIYTDIMRFELVCKGRK